MKSVHIIAFILVIIGALNWGLVGIGGFLGSDWNVVAMIFSFSQPVLWIVYVLVGLSALYLAFTHGKTCKMCSSGTKGAM